MGTESDLITTTQISIETGVIVDTKQSDESKVDRSVQYHILPQAGGFTVKIIYPQNSIHRVGGFKTKDDAQTWIGEAQVLMGRSRWFE